MSQHIGPEITSTEALITRAAKFNELISFIGNIEIFQKAFYGLYYEGCVSSIQIQIQKVIKTHLFSLHNNQKLFKENAF